MATIQNGNLTPINVKTGTIPDMGGALLNWFQPMVFAVVEKLKIGFQVVEIGNPVYFRGVIQPFSDTKLALLPQGQRSWSYFTVHAAPSLRLQVDSVVVYNCKRYRVLSRINHTIYNYIEYSMVEDWTHSGPSLIALSIDGGNARTTYYCPEFEIDNGIAATKEFSLPDVDGGNAEAA